MGRDSQSLGKLSGSILGLLILLVVVAWALDCVILPEQANGGIGVDPFDSVWIVPLLDPQDSAIPIRHGQTVTDPGEYEVSNHIDHLTIRGQNIHVNGNGYTIGRLEITGSDISVMDVHCFAYDANALQIGHSGAGADRITITGFTVIGNNGPSDINLVSLYDAVDIELADGEVSLDGVSEESDDVLQMQYCYGVAFERVHLFGTGNTQCLLRNETDNVTFRDCSINMGETGLLIGGAGTSGGHVIEDCDISGGSVGIYFHQGSYSSHIRRSRISGGSAVQFHRGVNGTDAFSIVDSYLTGKLWCDKRGTNCPYVIASGTVVEGSIQGGCCAFDFEPLPPPPEPPDMACCVDVGHCVVMDEEACLALGGIPTPAAECVADLCGAVPPPPPPPPPPTLRDSVWVLIEAVTGSEFRIPRQEWP